MVSSLVFRVVCTWSGYVYPAYSSYKAIKYKNIKEYNGWMMYWIVFALWIAAELVFDFFVSWLPFYYFAKTAFVIYLSHFRGGIGLYKSVIHPTFRQHEQVIDEAIDSAASEMRVQSVKYGRIAMDYIQNIIVHSANHTREFVVRQMLAQQERRMLGGTADNDAASVGTARITELSDNEEDGDKSAPQRTRAIRPTSLKRKPSSKSSATATAAAPSVTTRAQAQAAAAAVHRQPTSTSFFSRFSLSSTTSTPTTATTTASSSSSSSAVPRSSSTSSSASTSSRRLPETPPQQSYTVPDDPLTDSWVVDDELFYERADDLFEEMGSPRAPSVHYANSKANHHDGDLSDPVSPYAVPDQSSRLRRRRPSTPSSDNSAFDQLNDSTSLAPDPPKSRWGW